MSHPLICNEPAPDLLSDEPLPVAQAGVDAGEHGRHVGGEELLLEPPLPLVLIILAHHPVSGRE